MVQRGGRHERHGGSVSADRRRARVDGEAGRAVRTARERGRPGRDVPHVDVAGRAVRGRIERGILPRERDPVAVVADLRLAGVAARRRPTRRDRHEDDRAGRAILAVDVDDAVVVGGREAVRGGGEGDVAAGRRHRVARAGRGAGARAREGRAEAVGAVDEDGRARRGGRGRSGGRRDREDGGQESVAGSGDHAADRARGPLARRCRGVAAPHPPVRSLMRSSTWRRRASSVCPDDMQADVDVKLLGPLDVRVAGSAVEFVGAKQRTLFSALALRAPEPVPVDDLIEALWGGDPPGGAIQALQKQISRLRERLGDDAPLRTAPRATRWRSSGERSTPSASRTSSAAPGPPSPAARPIAHGPISPGPSPCGGVRRWPSTASTASPSSRSRGWRSCGSRRSRSGWRRSSPADATSILPASCMRWSPSTPCASGCAPS